jgi:hemerythrin
MTLLFNPMTMGTGADSLDAQHRELIAIINRLIEATDAGRARHEVGGILDELALYATTHFTHEEGCMARFVCPVAAYNKVAHAAFVRTFTAMRADFETAGPSAEMAERMRRELAGWIAGHIVSVDANLRSCIPVGTRA